MLKRQNRLPSRAAPLQCMLSAHGHCRLITHLSLAYSENLDSDVVFGVKESLF